MQKRALVTIIASAVALSLLASAWLFWEYQQLFVAATQGVKTDTASYLSTRVAPLVRSGDFTTTDEPRRRAAFAGFVSSIQSPDIVRIKVWDNQYTVIWSDLAETIGQRFPDNKEVTEALGGEAQVELVSADKAEHVTERQFDYLAEIYVPIRDTQGAIVGIFEVYKPASAIQQKLSSDFKLMIVYAFLGVVLGTAAMAFLMRRRSR